MTDERKETVGDVLAETRMMFPITYAPALHEQLASIKSAHAREIAEERAIARGLYDQFEASVEARNAIIAEKDAEIERLKVMLRRGIGAIEAYAMERRGVPANWVAIDATQDAMRGASKP